MSKYGAKKVTYDGKTFDSQKEAQRYAELRLLERGGVIKDLKCQVKFELIPTQRNMYGNKIVEKAVNYIADFVYTDVKLDDTVVEDTKGFRTKEYIIKRKLMLWVHGIEIKEV